MLCVIKFDIWANNFDGFYLTSLSNIDRVSPSCFWTTSDIISSTKSTKFFIFSSSWLIFPISYIGIIALLIDLHIGQANSPSENPLSLFWYWASWFISHCIWYFRRHSTWEKCLQLVMTAPEPEKGWTKSPRILGRSRGLPDYCLLSSKFLSSGYKQSSSVSWNCWLKSEFLRALL